MNEFKINIQKDTLYINDSGCVIGVVCFSVNDYYFPSKGWDDFVVSFIYWLTHIIIELNFNKKKTVEMRFMEGCFKLYISLNEKNQSIIQCVEGDDFADQEEVIQKTVVIPFDDLKAEVKSACELLIRIKESKELDFEDDYEDLKESYELLCKC